MRWLVCHPGPNFSVADVYAGWVEALRDLGEQVATYNLDARLAFYDAALFEAGQDEDGRPRVRKALTREQAVELATNGLLAACYQVWPDVVLVISALLVPTRVLDVVRARGHRVVIVHTESPYEDDRQLRVAEHADVNLVNDPVNLERFRAVGPAWYVPHAYRPSVHHPGSADPALACDLAFVGTGYPSRIAFFEAMDLDGVDVLLAGNWQALDAGSPLRGYVAHDPDECVDNTQTAAIYRSARCGINLYRREAERPELTRGWAVGPREVEMAACGLFFLREPRGEGDELLPMLPTFQTPGEASELLRWWLAHPDQRARAARAARAAVADRTFHQHAVTLLKQLDRQPVTQPITVPT